MKSTPCAEFGRPFYALAGQLHARIGLCAAQFKYGHALRLELFAHKAHKAAAHNRAAAVMQQHAAAAVLTHIFADVLFLALSEIELYRALIGKIQHALPPFRYLHRLRMLTVSCFPKFWICPYSPKRA